MTTNTENTASTLPEGVKINTFRHTNKDRKEYRATLEINGREIPISVSGFTTDEARKSAMTLFNDKILNSLSEMDKLPPTNDSLEAQNVFIDAFLRKDEVAEVTPKVRKSAGEGDKRTIKGLKFVVPENGPAIKVPGDEVDSYLQQGYHEGRIFNKPTKIAGNKRKEEGYVSPLKGQKWVNDGKSRKRVNESEEQDYLDKGYSKGRGTFKDEVPPAKVETEQSV